MEEMVNVEINLKIEGGNLVVEVFYAGVQAGIAYLPLKELKKALDES